MRTVVSVLVAAIVASCTGAPGGTPGTTSAQAPTTESTVAPTPQPSEIAPGIITFTPHTSAVYGITLGYPDGWTLDSAASRKWQESDESDTVFPAYQDVFMNPEARDGDQIGLGVFQRPAGANADITSREGLAAWAAANACDEAIDACETVPDVAMPMCLGKVACLPAVLVPLSDGTGAYFADPTTGLVTVVSIFRPDNFPAAARYGGSVELLKSILTTMDVWTPEPGQIQAP